MCCESSAVNLKYTRKSIYLDPTPPHRMVRTLAHTVDTELKTSVFFLLLWRTRSPHLQHPTQRAVCVLPYGAPWRTALRADVRRSQDRSQDRSTDLHKNRDAFSPQPSISHRNTPRSCIRVKHSNPSQLPVQTGADESSAISSTLRFPRRNRRKELGNRVPTPCLSVFQGRRRINVCDGHTNAAVPCQDRHKTWQSFPTSSLPVCQGMRYINGYDDVEIVAGAGTMGMEILEQVPAKDQTRLGSGSGDS